METEPVSTIVPGKKPSDSPKAWILILSVYVLCCVTVVGAVAWGSYSVFQTVSEKANTPYETATALAQWPIVFHDDFSKVSDIWYVGSYSKDGYIDTRSITKGIYSWEISTPEGYTFWQNAGLDGLSDFVLSVDVRHTSGSSLDGYGLNFRDASSNHYMFFIRDNGEYALSLYSAGQWNEIIPLTRSSLIRPNEFNHLTVQAQGQRFQLFINGKYVNEFEDDTLTAGDVGMMFSMCPESEIPVTQQPQGIAYSHSNKVYGVVFDNFEVRAPQALAVGTSRPSQLPSIRPDAGKLVFVSDRGGDRNIYSINTDGSNLKQLTDDPAADYGPRWSPDGKKIVFASRRDGNSEIYIMDADGGHLTRLTDSPGEDLSPDWSPDGKQIIFASYHNGNFDIYMMSANGEKDTLTQLTDKKDDEINPSISPDGSHILYQAKMRTIYRPMLMLINGKESRHLLSYDNPYIGSDAAWAPDGQKYVYVEKGYDGLGTIIISDVQSAGEQAFYTRITQNMDNSLYPNWSPDGEQLVFVSNMGGQSDIYITLPDGSGLFRVTHSEAIEESPDWAKP